MPIYSSQKGQHGILQDLWFAALMLPATLSARVETVTEELSSKFQTGVSTAPPHITLIPPFRMGDRDLATLEAALDTFSNACTPVQMDVSGFGCFQPRVLYVDVVRGEIIDAKERLDAVVQERCPFVPRDRRGFNPHVSVASKRVTPDSFAEAWAYLKDRDFEGSWVGNEITLLKFDDRSHAWSAYRTFKLVGV